MNVGVVDCTRDGSLCGRLDVDSGRTVFYFHPPIGHSNGLTIQSLYVKEIADIILHQLPEITVLSDWAFEVRSPFVPFKLGQITPDFIN